MKRNIHEIWKEYDGWKLQGPNARLTFKTKKRAVEWANMWFSALTEEQKQTTVTYKLHQNT